MYVLPQNWLINSYPGFIDYTKVHPFSNLDNFSRTKELLNVDSQFLGGTMMDVVPGS